MSRDVVLTGLRANSTFHIGNYLGAIKPLVNFQKKHTEDSQVNMFIPDLHSLTTPIDHNTLYKQTIENLKVYVAAGLDIENKNTYIYRQSFVSAHSELTWILDCFTYMGELSRMTQFKEKSEDKSSSIGLFNYPVLMASDILLYDAKWVPLGDDQKQHLELARDIAARFNNKFGDIFVLPEVWQKQLEQFDRDQSVRIRSLRKSKKKMSKSVDDPAGTILITDDPGQAKQKVLSATTDLIGSINLDWQKQPGISNLLQISSLLEGTKLVDTAKKWEGKTSYGDLKKTVAEQVFDFLELLQSKLKQVDEAKLLKKLEEDEIKMNEVADAKLLEVQKAVGLRQ